ncbi:MAG: hypothetical protein Q8R28_21885, partial [Dehalococcoidia bacterium]|nr:hypothetical protein [Dehalococcoidia bacterium]
INLFALEDEFLQERPLLYFLSRQAGADDDFYDIKIGSNGPAHPGTPCGIGYNDGYFGSPADRLSPNCLAILGAKRLVYRYAIYAHQLICAGDPKCTGVSGIGDLSGDDFMVTFGGWPAASVNRTSESGTFMHELGHTLDLHHGGADDTQYKPNFLSIMNYSFQLGQLVPHPLDYSRWALSSLNEAALQEQKGIDNNAPPADLAARWPDTLHSFYETATDICRWAIVPTVGDGHSKRRRRWMAALSVHNRRALNGDASNWGGVTHGSVSQVGMMQSSTHPAIPSRPDARTSDDSPGSFCT